MAETRRLAMVDERRETREAENAAKAAEIDAEVQLRVAAANAAAETRIEALTAAKLQIVWPSRWPRKERRRSFRERKTLR